MDKLAPYYHKRIKVERSVNYLGEPNESFEYKIPNKNGDFVLRVDTDLELCSMQFNRSSGRWMKEDLIKLKALLNSCNFI
ncbi:hypothetical protein [Citrobacter phage Ci1]|nr:hypothetical protein [Citrobacter phage Ci1]